MLADLHAQVTADYNLIYLHRLKKSTNAGETYKVFLNDQNIGKLNGINLALSDQAKDEWLVMKYTGQGILLLKITDSKNVETGRISIDPGAGRDFYIEFNAAAGYGVKPLKKLMQKEGHESFRTATIEDIEFSPKDISKEILASRMNDLPEENEKMNENQNDVHKTEDFQFNPQDQLRSNNVKMEGRPGTEFNAGITAKKFYGLVVGIEEYLDPAINSLDQPVKDARSFYDVLVNYYTFEKGNVTFLVNPKREELTKALDKLVEKITPEDNLIIFYAGHGHWDEKLKQGYWLPADAKSGDRGSWFSNADLKTYIGGINARHTLLITDACFGGGIFKTREAFRDANSDIQELYKYPSRKAMTSGSLNVVPDKSVFIEFLIKRLKENNDKYISAEQIFASFKTAVINNSVNNQIPQFGEIRDTGDEGGDFIFMRKQ